MLNSFETTVSTPPKWPGRTTPSSSSPSGPGCTVTCAPSGYMSSTDGAKTMPARSSRQMSTSDSNWRGYFARSSFGPNCNGFTKIDTTITVFCMTCASRISCRWPACRAPIVGTRATLRPALRSALITRFRRTGSRCTVTSSGR